MMPARSGRRRGRSIDRETWTAPIASGSGPGSGHETEVGSRLVDDVGAAPRIGPDEPPAMPGAGVVLRQQHVARPDGEARARLDLEFERSRQGDDELRPADPGATEGAARCGFLERQFGDRDRQTDALPCRPSPIAMCPSSKQELPSSPVHSLTQRIMTVRSPIVFAPFATSRSASSRAGRIDAGRDRVVGLRAVRPVMRFPIARTFVSPVELARRRNRVPRPAAQAKAFRRHRGADDRRPVPTSPSRGVLASRAASRSDRGSGVFHSLRHGSTRLRSTGPIIARPVDEPITEPMRVDIRARFRG